MYINKVESHIKKSEIFTPVGKTLALYCQSFSMLTKFYEPDASNGISLNPTWLPKEAFNKIISPKYCYLNKEEAYIEFGGGLYHFGYTLSLNIQDSSPTTNVWQLFMYNEGSDKRLLTTYNLDINCQFSLEEMENFSRGQTSQ